MTWEEARALHPNQWLVVEIIQSHDEESWNILDDIAVLEVCPSAQVAYHHHQRSQRQHPQRDLVAIHTSYTEGRMAITFRGVGPRRQDGDYRTGKLAISE